MTGGQALEGLRDQIRYRLYLGAEARAAHAAAHARQGRPARSRNDPDQALNERDYGDLSGLNKDDARAKWGEEQVHIWRRSYDIPPPGGESLRDTGARVWPYYLTEILPRVLTGENVLVAAHGNSLRSLVMVLDRLSKEGRSSRSTSRPACRWSTSSRRISTVASKEVLGDMSGAH